MERIKQALDKARQERQARQDSGGSDATARHHEPAVPGHVVTHTVNLDEKVMRDNRIIAAMPTEKFSDAYSLLRTRILQTFKENGWNTLAVTSPRPGAGNTLTAINLAISIAREVDYTVLLVDANLREPWMVEKFGLTARKGLSDYLADDLPVSELLLRPAEIGHLVILPGGHPLANSAEMLNSPRMGKLADEMKSRYHSRIIIYDLPPVLTSSDTLAFMPNVDAVLVVVEEGKTQKADLQQTTELLGNTNIVGTVLNKAEP